MQYNEILNIGVTIVRLHNYKEIEPYAPNPFDRIGLIKQLFAAGIGCNIIIRPLFPDIEYCELDEIVALTKEFCFGYLVGPLYFNTQVERYLKVHRIDCDIELKYPAWNQYNEMKAINVARQINYLKSLDNATIYLSNEECVNNIKSIFKKKSRL